MTNKFEIGSVWKTRGGWRAVVVDNDGKYVTVWHKKAGEDIMIHSQDGMLQSNCPGDFDLIEPWVEPKVHDVWINIYKDGCGGMVALIRYTKEEAKEIRDKSSIACINLKFSEGEGL